MTRMRFHIGIRSWVTLLFVLMMLIGLGAVVGFARLEQAIERVLQDEYRGLRAAQQLRRVVAEQRLKIVETFATPGPDEAARLQPAAAAAAQAVQRALAGAGVTPADERLRERWALVGQACAAYSQALLALDGAADAAAVRQWHAAGLLPVERGLGTALDGWELECERRMELRRETAMRRARSLSVGMVIATFVGMLALLFFNHQVEETVLRPAVVISDLLGRATGGETALRLPVQGEDYLNRVATACNRLLDSLTAVTEESRRRVEQERHTAVVLIEAIAAPAVVVDMSGELLLANGAARDLFMEATGAEQLERFQATLRAGQSDVHLGEQSYHLREITGAESAHTAPVVVIVLERLGSGVGRQGGSGGGEAGVA